MSTAAAGLQVNVHAIGDRAIDSHLDAIERIVSENGRRGGCLWQRLGRSAANTD